MKPTNRIYLALSKFSSLIALFGLRAAVVQLMRNILWLETMYRFKKDLKVSEPLVEPEIPLNIVPMPQDLDIREWESRNEILEIRGNYGLNQFQQRLERGYILFCAYSEGIFAGFIWLLLPPVGRIDSGIVLKEDEAYQIDGWVFEKFRGNRILAALQQGTYEFVRKNHPYISAIFTHGATRNKPSIVGQKRSGLIIKTRDISISFFGHNRKIKLNDVKEFD